MHGNVWEWVEDAEGSSRVRRGGSWYFSPQLLRSALRRWGTPTVRYDYLGFRVASTLTARVVAFTDAAREQRVRPEPAMMSGRREWFAAPSRAAAVLPDIWAGTAASLPC